MRLSLITLYPPANAAGPGPSAAVVVDLLWVVALPQDKVEHISVRAAPERIQVGVFTTLPDREAALAAVGLAARACACSALLSGWTWIAPGHAHETGPPIASAPPED
ncbi:hypothetical protein [Actinospica robiniae]|uniref:hypothetical protein n=1 Tax=Actinospica robiniae TaxID=304901 RepID=UPI0004234437|nr:hypothetical protein [Actinospica robiniae]